MALGRERFGARNPKSWMFRTLIGGGGSAFVVQEPENNIVRGAYIALAAALSGAQTMALPTYDEAYTIPSAKAQVISDQPPSSYELTVVGETTELRILSPDRFRTVKHVVIMTS